MSIVRPHDGASQSANLERFRKGNRCPICGGCDDDPRGQGVRCAGFLSSDGKYAHCTREEHAGSLPVERNGTTYAHRLAGECRCGRTHGGPIEAPRSGRTATNGRGRKTWPTAADLTNSLARVCGTFTNRWTYHAASGAEAFRVLRFERDGEKTYRPIHKSESGWVAGKPEGKLPIYRLPEILGHDGTVWILEGERCADLARELGLGATTSAHGAKSAHLSDWTPLKGRDVVIVPDCGDEGEHYAAAVAEILGGLGCRVRVVRLPGLVDGEDLVEWTERGGTRAELERIAGLVDGDVAMMATAEPQATEPHEPEPESDVNRAVILITTDEHVVADETIKALASEPNLFTRSCTLVTVKREDGKAKSAIRRPVGSPRLAVASVPTLREMASRHAAFIRETSRRGQVSKAPAHVPGWLVPAIAERGDWPGLKPLAGIVEAPTMREDGSILTDPGYDHSTGLLYMPSTEFPDIPDKPTKRDATVAAGRLLDLVQDFPFKDEAHKAAWLAALVTVQARYAIPGPVPMFVIDASSAGSGKTKLADLIATICFGRQAAKLGYPDSDEEMSKLLLAVALAGDPFVVFDNLAGGQAVGSPALDRAITASVVNGRILGQSRTTGELELCATFMPTGNNISPRGDTLRRVIPIRLESPEVRPEEREDFKIDGDLIAYTQERRAGFVRDVLVILRAYHVAGRPKHGLRRMDFVAWSDLPREAVCWVTGNDPAATRDGLIADDPATAEREAIVQNWMSLCGGPGEGRAMSANDALNMLKQVEGNSGPPGTGPLHEAAHALHNTFTTWTRDGSLPSPKAVGHRLNQIRGQMTEAGAMDCRILGGNRLWFVRAKPR
jgi:hypothetical protein